MVSFHHRALESRLTSNVSGQRLTNLGSGDPCWNDAAPGFHILKAERKLMKHAFVVSARYLPVTDH